MTSDNDALCPQATTHLSECEKQDRNLDSDYRLLAGGPTRQGKRGLPPDLAYLKDKVEKGLRTFPANSPPLSYHPHCRPSGPPCALLHVPWKPTVALGCRWQSLYNNFPRQLEQPAGYWKKEMGSMLLLFFNYTEWKQNKTPHYLGTIFSLFSGKYCILYIWPQTHSFLWHQG